MIIITVRPSSPTNPIAYSLKSNSDRPSTPTKPDRLFPQIKQRSPPHYPHSRSPIPPNQTAIT
ncbi:MAG: hypothetical protein M1G31_04940 [Pseudanabaena sp. Salubria-1]|nr:hypothetical protein [Pseudanabaena sp. Salubria-1]